MNNLKIKPMDSQQLSYKTKRALISIIQENGKDGKPFKLPNEDELARSLNVSRNVLRDALMSLEEMGMVTRRRSKGTLASPLIANTKCRLDTDPELVKMMQHAGYDTRIETIFLGIDPKCAPDPDGKLLNITSKKIFYTNDVPTAYCIDQFVNDFSLSEDEIIERMKGHSHKEILEDIYNTAYAYTLAHIDAIIPNKELCKYLSITPKTPVIKLLDEGFNYDHELVVRTITYFRSGTLDLKVLRKSW